MSWEPSDLFIICDAKDVGLGSAASFHLSRNGGNGESRPFPIVVVRTLANGFVGYVNARPHEGRWLNIGAGEFFTDDRAFLRFGRHGARFEIETGLCVDGSCKGKNLKRLAIEVGDGDVCMSGVSLVEDDRPRNRFDEDYETMEVMIHPDRRARASRRGSREGTWR